MSHDWSDLPPGSPGRCSAVAGQFKFDAAVDAAVTESAFPSSWSRALGMPVTRFAPPRRAAGRPPARLLEPRAWRGIAGMNRKL